MAEDPQGLDGELPIWIAFSPKTQGKCKFKQKAEHNYWQARNRYLATAQRTPAVTLKAVRK